MRSPLYISPRTDPEGAVVLFVVGEIDSSNSHELAAAVETALRRTEGRVLLDLSGVDYIGSAGLRILFAHAARIEVVTGRLIARTLRLIGLPAVTAVRELDEQGR